MFIKWIHLLMRWNCSRWFHVNLRRYFRSKSSFGVLLCMIPFLRLVRQCPFLKYNYSAFNFFDLFAKPCSNKSESLWASLYESFLNFYVSVKREQELHESWWELRSDRLHQWEFSQLSCPGQTRTRIARELMMYGRFVNFHILVKQEQELRRIGYRFARESLVSGSETKTIKVAL